MALTIAVPIIGFTAVLTQQKHAQIDLASRERVGLGYALRTEAVLHALRALRDRVGIDGTDGRVERAQVQSALDRLYAYSSTTGRDLSLLKELARFQMRWSSVAAGSRSTGEIDATIDTAVKLFYYIYELSYLNRDRDANTGQSIDALGTQLPALADSADLAKVTLLRGLQGPHGLPAARTAAAAQMGEARWALSLALKDVTASMNETPSLERELAVPMRSTADRLWAFDEIVRRPVLGQNRQVLAVQLRQRGDAVEAASYAAHHALVYSVDGLLAERIRTARAMVWLLVLFALVAIALGGGLVAQIARTIWHRDRAELRRAQAAAARLSSELARRRAVEELTASEARFRAVFDGSSVGVAMIRPDGSILKANRALKTMLGAVHPELIGAAHPAFRAVVEGKQEAFATEISAKGNDSETKWFDVSVSLVRDDGRPLFAMSMVKDVTERKRADARLRHDATHDILSGLPNRALFFDELRSAHVRAGRGEAAAVLFVDLDEFKFVNDSLGHTVGDRVLVAVAERLREAAGPRDLVARLGGDEFGLLARDRRTPEDVAGFVAEIERALARPLYVDGRDIFVTASIGVAPVDASYAAVEEILRDADTAMYHAKSTGRARHAIFDRAMHARAARRLALATSLRYAIERNEFRLVYQPIVSMATGRVESYEALLRWTHPELGPISPVEFIPIAEDIGLIVPIGRTVLARACAQLADWKRRGVCDAHTRVNVNASVREILQPDYVETVERIVAAAKLRPADVVLEITEGSILTSGKFSDGALDALKSAGVGLSIDDFGTGYSSLRYLHQFPFDEFKIDRSFVAGTASGLASEAIVTMLIALGHALGVSVVAEGVETQSQAARLRALGCARAQGFHFSRPRSAADIAEELSAGGFAGPRHPVRSAVAS